MHLELHLKISISVSKTLFQEAVPIGCLTAMSTVEPCVQMPDILHGHVTIAVLGVS